MRFVDIDLDRYSGAYSGAAYTAWDGNKPDEVDAGDGTCEEFWRINILPCGKGATPQEAFVDLLKQLGEGAWWGWFDLIDLGDMLLGPERFIPTHSPAFTRWITPVISRIEDHPKP